MQPWGKRDDVVVHEEEPYNAEPTPAALDASGALTPTEVFYSRNHGAVPDLDAAEWRLVVDGLVDRPATWSLAELRAGFNEVTSTATLQCAGNRRRGFLAVADIPGEDPWGSGAIGTATWTGVRLADVLAASGTADGATDVAFEAPDVALEAVPPQAYGSSVPLAKAVLGDVLLAWAMNGEPLTPLHGAPVRVVAPSYIGARSVKWVQRVSVTNRPSTNYFQETAYRILPAGADPAGAGHGDGISLGPWSLGCDILRPDDGATVPSGTLTLSGWAVAAEHRRVARVDVSANGGASWCEATLLGEHADGVWRRWTAEVDVAAPASGDPVEVVARAWDDTGAQQPADAASLWNPKGYGNTSWPRLRLHVEG